MGKPYTQLYTHLVWATWDRLPLIKPEFANRIYAGLRQETLDMHCETIALGGVEDHVHLLLQMPPTLCVSEVIKQLKGNSSHLVNREIAPLDGFKWQGYYGAFSVSRGDLRRVEDYVNHQEERHANQQLWDNAERTQYPDSE